MHLHVRRLLLGQILVLGVALIGVPPALVQLRPEPGTIELAPHELVDRLKTDPIAHFRFVNRPWIARVCDAFADDLRAEPSKELGGQ